MFALLFGVFIWEKLTFSKLAGKVNFSEIKFEEMLSKLQGKIQGKFAETFILALLFSAVFGLQNHVSDFF